MKRNWRQKLTIRAFRKSYDEHTEEWKSKGKNAALNFILHVTFNTDLYNKKEFDKDGYDWSDFLVKKYAAEDLYAEELAYVLIMNSEENLRNIYKKK